MEIYPTCLRQSGISIGAICANSLGIFGPYVIYLGTEFDVRYPYMIMGKLKLQAHQPSSLNDCHLSILGSLCFIGFVCAMMLPETLHHKLPNTLHEAKKFGKEQVSKAKATKSI